MSDDQSKIIKHMKKQENMTHKQEKIIQQGKAQLIKTDLKMVEVIEFVDKILKHHYK